MRYSTMLGVSIIGTLIAAFTLSSLCYAEIFYEEDFEDGGKNWEFLGGVEVSNKKAHSGSKSVLVTEGTGAGDSANLLIKMSDTETLYDIIWLYLDSAKPGAGYMYLNTWTLTLNVEALVGPHVAIMYDAGGFINWHSKGVWTSTKDQLDVGVWYKIKTIMNMKENSFDLYYQKEGKEEIQSIKGGIFITDRGNVKGDMPPGSENYRRINSWAAVSAEAYFDDYVLADEEPKEAVDPANKLSTCWSKIKKGGEYRD
ncbi:hypothetical protein H8E77_32355 [bacterium]|nr:hypothetical protein [bacterium]